MTKTDLYLEYKNETGYYPEDRGDYIEWLENKLITILNTKIEYQINGKILTSIIKNETK